MPSYAQDMPPMGGYGPIDAMKKPAKKTLNGLLLLAGLYASTFLGLAYQRMIRSKRDAIVKEDTETRIALTPFLLAEQQRLYMKQLLRNRVYETELMKDVSDWKVGHWYDYPVYHNPRNLWCDPNINEFYAHTTQKFRDSHIHVGQDYS